MTRPMIRINDFGNIIDREMNDTEFAEWQIIVANSQAKAQAEADAKAKRSAALAKLEALGLDEDDLKALGL